MVRHHSQPHLSQRLFAAVEAKQIGGWLGSAWKHRGRPGVAYGPVPIFSLKGVVPENRAPPLVRGRMSGGRSQGAFAGAGPALSALLTWGREMHRGLPSLKPHLWPPRVSPCHRASASGRPSRLTASTSLFQITGREELVPFGVRRRLPRQSVE